MSQVESARSGHDELFAEHYRQFLALLESASEWTDSQLWERILHHQSTLYIPEDLRFLFNLPSWQRAEQVLDVGCGHGDFLNRLAQFFPGKQYLGVDLEAAHIAAARTGSSRRNVSFEQGDAETFSDGRYDVVIARLLLQHVANAEEVVDHLVSLLKPGGTLLVMEADDDKRLFQPEIPELEIFYREVRALQNRGDSVRAEAQRLEENAARHGLNVFASDRSPSPICRPRDRVRLAHIFLLIASWALRNGLEVDARRLAFDLANWSVRDHGYAQICLHRLALGRDRRNSE